MQEIDHGKQTSQQQSPLIGGRINQGYRQLAGSASLM